MADSQKNFIETSPTHAQRMRDNSGRRSAWILMIAGGMTLGLAIWSMHFNSMLTFHLPIPLGYDLPLTLLSALLTIAAAMLGFYVLRKPDIGTVRIIVSGMLMAICISIMHYTALVTLRMPPPISYDLLIFILLVVCAVIASWGALLMMYQGERVKLTPMLRFALGDSILAALFDRRMARHNAQALAQLEQTHNQTLRELEYQKYALDQHSIVSITDVRGTITYVNEKFSAISRYSRDELLGQNHRIINSGTHPREFFRDMYRTIATGKVWHGDCCNRAKDGSLYWVSTAIVPNVGDNGKPFQYVSIRTDISAHKLIQRELKHNQDLLNEAQRLGKLGSWELNLVSGELLWSDEIYRIFELDPARFSPSYENFMGVIHPDDRDKVNQAYTHSLENCQPCCIDYRLRLADGRIKWVREHWSSKFDVSGKPLSSMGSTVDITQFKNAEDLLKKQNKEIQTTLNKLQEVQQQLLQSEKLASMGQLAAGVAHEINNPIGYINSNLTSLKNYIDNLLALVAIYEKSEATSANTEELAQIKAFKQKIDLEYLKTDVLDLLEESHEGATRVKKIVQDLKDFSHLGGNDDWQWTNLHTGLESTLNIVNSEIKYKAKIVKELGDLPEVKCLPHQLNQVFMNLLVNAAHAIENKGTITLRTGTENDRVWVEISDTGKGIAPEHQSKIFDPFFTTKPVGTGTGLGLSVSYTIIKKHQGEIQLTSQLGQGTTFRIVLPISGAVIEND